MARTRRSTAWCAAVIFVLAAAEPLPAQQDVEFPPRLPEGKQFVSERANEFLEPPSTLAAGVVVAKTPPPVDVLYFPGQTYPGKPWSAWGEGLAVNGKYYASLGDHLAPQGNAFVYEYDPKEKSFRLLMDVRNVLKLPAGHYTPGKIHTRLDLGSDGWLYCATHRGSMKATTDANHYLGDWILRCDPATGKSEAIARGPAGKHCIPNGALDPQRMIFYGGTAPGTGRDDEGIRFFAWDLVAGNLLYRGENGPARSMIVATSTGRVYYTSQLSDGPLMRFDPAVNSPPAVAGGRIGIRAATRETPQGIVYTVSPGQRGAASTLFAFDTKSEKIETLGPAAVGEQNYVASLQADPVGRFLYYVPGAHGGAHDDGSPVVQFDTQTRRRKVIAFLHPHFERKYGFSLRGTYSIAVDPAGDKLFIAWNTSRGGKAWDCVALAIVHIPDSER
jgi:hypothetical protein